MKLDRDAEEEDSDSTVYRQITQPREKDALEETWTDDSASPGQPTLSTSESQSIGVKDLLVDIDISSETGGDGQAME